MASANSSDKVYKIDPKKDESGYCLILNNWRYPNEEKFPRLVSAYRDVDALTNAFRRLNFNVKTYENLSGQGLISKCRKVANRSYQLNKHDAFVCAVLAHGDYDNVVYGVDEEPVRLEKMMKFFNNDKCKALKNKPKLFLIDACRGSKIDKIVTEEIEEIEENFTQNDASEDDSVWSDTFICYGTIPDYVCWMCPETGSYFSQTFVQCLLEYTPIGLDLECIADKISEELQKKKISAKRINPKTKQIESFLCKQNIEVRKLLPVWKLVFNVKNNCENPNLKMNKQEN